MADNAYRTDQEKFWAGEFGTEYIQRNKSDQLLASNLHLFSHALRQARALTSGIEFGANIGMNLKALKLLYPSAQFDGIEINATAAGELRSLLGADHVHQGSILEFQPSRTWDLVFIKGVLIHINPDVLPEVYDLLVRSSGRYVLVAEYYNPAPVEISYRGHEKRLFKRDFAGEIMERHKELKLIDYGFAYRRDPSFPQDDITWFLMEKTA